MYQLSIIKAQPPLRPGGGGGTLIFSYFRIYVGSGHYFGFKILNFNNFSLSGKGLNTYHINVGRDVPLNGVLFSESGWSRAVFHH